MTRVYYYLIRFRTIKTVNETTLKIVLLFRCTSSIRQKGLHLHNIHLHLMFISMYLHFDKHAKSYF